jgi:2-methylcitrate dehydratase PrpD
MEGEVTQALARFAAALAYEQIPLSAREHTKNLLLDALACAIAGDRGEETHQVAALASALAQSRETSVIGGDRCRLPVRPC